MEKFKVPIRGMHCKSCELLIEDCLRSVDGIATVNVSHTDGIAKVSYVGKKPSDEKIRQAVQKAGYEVGQKDNLPWISRNPKDYEHLFYAAVILSLIFFIAYAYGLFRLSVTTDSGSLWVVLLVGLVAGVSTCMALVGGLVLGFAARHSDLHPEATAAQKFRPHLFFNLGRILGFAILGALIALIGSAFTPSASVMGLLTIIVGLVMIFLGLKLVEIFPKLRDKGLTLPKSLSRLLGLRRENKEYSHRGTFIAGALTFFLPCGFTQAMQLYAISSGSPIKGALIMSLFALGTAPGLLGIGGLSSVFKGVGGKIFFMTAGLTVILLGFFNISNASRVVFANGVGFTTSENVVSTGPDQVINMTQNENGYSPNQFTVVKGRKVRWVINSVSRYSCASYISMPSYGISQPLKLGENIIEFTPTKTGTIPFSCSMGMYRGQFTVIADGSQGANAGGALAAAQIAAPSKAGSSCGAGGGGCGCGGGNRAPVQPQEGSVQTEPSNDGSSIQVLKTTYTTAKDIVPNSFKVKAGQPVRMEVEAADNGSGCMSTIMIPGLFNQPELLQRGKTIVMSFTPTKPGQYPITCAMGVPRGNLTVI